MSEQTDIIKREQPFLRARLAQLAALINERHVTLWIYAGIAVFGELSERIDSEAAAKLLSPAWLFGCSTACSATWKMLLALKMVMSTSWANGTGKLDAVQARIDAKLAAEKAT